MCKLSDEQIIVFSSKLPTWKFENNALTKTFQQNDFKASIVLVNAIAGLAEEANHHPDIRIQYNKVTVTLTTHDSGGVTGKDFLLAQQIDAI
ncbi:4a-hydroxytetrahydrobiopterin dehydratase [Paenibacillus eucommiae]|uniref:4a-hydroxytetrahydrobiopterin dehydratase n=1 Tax=Paenibacillus eucommiae TaxID=1355755 RepID=A0ABS4JAN7_9BACL|nr:4a-hydroxytetrahydrobiopterin dehydratase [Paenibacillus eucommiae]MBP1996906.1 4a-hydroxytetrahydrobiopterin dehydratase [Paenibacillus eucommiae]